MPPIRVVKVSRAIGSQPRTVNSDHHQVVKDLAKGLRASAVSPDGLVEALESEGGRIIAVQWHPELMHEEMQELFAWFLARCGLP